jgi:hypothetical protein
VAAAVERALVAAQEPLRIWKTPPVVAVEWILEKWHRDRGLPANAA